MSPGAIARSQSRACQLSDELANPAGGRAQERGELRVCQERVTRDEREHLLGLATQPLAPIITIG